MEIIRYKMKMSISTRGTRMALVLSIFDVNTSGENVHETLYNYPYGNKLWSAQYLWEYGAGKFHMGQPTFWTNILCGA